MTKSSPLSNHKAKKLIQYFGTSPAADKLTEMWDMGRARSRGWCLLNPSTLGDDIFIVAAAIGLRVIGNIALNGKTNLQKGNYHEVIYAIGYALWEELELRSLAKIYPALVTKASATANLQSKAMPGSPMRYSVRRVTETAVRAQAHNRAYAGGSISTLDKTMLQSAGALVLHAILNSISEVTMRTVSHKKRRSRIIEVDPSFLSRVSQVVTPTTLTKAPLLTDPDTISTGIHAGLLVTKNWRMPKKSFTFSGSHALALGELYGQKVSVQQLGAEWIDNLNDVLIDSVPPPPEMPRRKNNPTPREWAIYYRMCRVRSKAMKTAFRTRRTVNASIRNDGRDGYQTYNLDYRGRIYVNDDNLNFQSNKFTRYLMLNQEKAYEHDDQHIQLQWNNAGLAGLPLSGQLVHPKALLAGYEMSEAFERASVYYAWHDRNEYSYRQKPVFYDFYCHGFQIIALLTGDRDLAKDTGLIGNFPNGQDLYSRLATACGMARDDVKMALTRFVYGARFHNVCRAVAKEYTRLRTWEDAVKVATDKVRMLVHMVSTLYPGIGHILTLREEVSERGWDTLEFYVPNIAHKVKMDYRRRDSKQIQLFTADNVSYKAYQSELTTQPDKRRNHNALIPNIIHACDSFVAANTVWRYRQDTGCAIFPVHDSFGADARVGAYMRQSIESLAWAISTAYDQGRFLEVQGLSGNSVVLPRVGDTISLNEITGPLYRVG